MTLSHFFRFTGFYRAMRLFFTKCLYTLAHLFFTAVAFLLVASFLFRLFAPGNLETIDLFYKLQPLQHALTLISNWLLTPVTASLKALSSPWSTHLFSILGLSSLKHNIFDSNFWIRPATESISQAISWLLQLPGLQQTGFGQALARVSVEQVFPGVLDWRILLALPIWGMLEMLVRPFYSTSCDL